nr:uncharacterized protein LOC128704156 [Cherax quadricarinatus]
MYVNAQDVEFSNEATLLLIEGIRKRYAELSSNNRSRPQVYKELHEELTMHGYNFSQERIRRKWNNLLGTFKRVKKEFSPKKPPWEYYQVFLSTLYSEYTVQPLQKRRAMGRLRKKEKKRERMKIRALRKIGKELQTIAKTQCEILKKQDQILQAIKASKV